MSRSRGLTLAEILEVSSPILRSEGARALSLRRVAEVLGVTPMALYHHVKNKRALVDLVLDEVLSEALEPAPDPRTPWQVELIEFAVRYRGLLVDNPGAGKVYVERPVVVPATARTTIRLFELLERGGFTGAAAAEAADAVVLVIMGSVVNDLSRPPDVRLQLQHAVDAEEARRLGRNLEVYAARDPEARFRKTLEWVIRGLVAEQARESVGQGQ